MDADVDALEQAWRAIYPDRVRDRRCGVTCHGCGLPALVIWTVDLCARCLHRELTT